MIIEEVKEHFKNAKEVRCTCLPNSIYNLKDYNIIIKGNGQFEGENILAVKKGFNFEGLDYIVLYKESTSELAEIISYKNSPMTFLDEAIAAYEVKDAEIVTPKHYNNDKGTLYKIANERGWNSYLFDIVKRLERSEKKGEFKQDLEKSIAVIQLWKKESEK